MEEDALQHRIYFLTFVESLELIFSQYTETCEVLLDYPKIGGVDIKDVSKKAIRNLLHANIDVHSRRLTCEFPADVMKINKKSDSGNEADHDPRVMCLFINQELESSIFFSVLRVLLLSQQI